MEKLKSLLPTLRWGLQKRVGVLHKLNFVCFGHKKARNSLITG